MIWRIRDRRGFERLARTGARVRSEALWCNYVNDPEATPPRVAFAIGRGVGSATARNRLRRRLRAILAEAPLPPGLYLIGARATAAELSFDALVREVAVLVDRTPATL